MTETRAVAIDSLDHLVLTVRDLDATLAFYRDWLGMKVVAFGEGRTALAFGQQKINLHVAGREIQPHAAAATPGSGDLCFLTSTPLADVRARAEALGIRIIEASRRTGARGPIDSVYARDPDGNLVEVSNRLY